MFAASFLAGSYGIHSDGKIYSNTPTVNGQFGYRAKVSADNKTLVVATRGDGRVGLYCGEIALIAWAASARTRQSWHLCVCKLALFVRIVFDIFSTFVNSVLAFGGFHVHSARC